MSNKDFHNLRIRNEKEKTNFEKKRKSKKMLGRKKVQSLLKTNKKWYCVKKRVLNFKILIGQFCNYFLVFLIHHPSSVSSWLPLLAR